MHIAFMQKYSHGLGSVFWLHTSRHYMHRTRNINSVQILYVQLKWHLLPQHLTIGSKSSDILLFKTLWLRWPLLTLNRDHGLGVESAAAAGGQ